MKSILKELSRSKLEKLYSEWSINGDNPELLKFIEERLNYIEKVNHDFVSYSSDRCVLHSEEDLQNWLNYMKKVRVGDFSFFADSNRSGNRIGVFMCNGVMFSPYSMTFEDLMVFYSSDKNIYDYETTYNTLNYIRDRFFTVGEDSLFKDYEEKRKVCELKLGDISRYLLDIKNGTKLKLSIGNTGLTRIANGTYSYIHPYQQSFIDAVAFGTDLDKLNDGNYEDAKRLLYLPKTVNRR